MHSIDAETRDQNTSSTERPARVDERRRRRSADPVTALHYQLAAARSLAELECVVLVDDSGLLVAGAGAWPVCEELAAYAPLLAHPRSIQTAAVGTRVAALFAEAEVHTLRVGRAEVLLCARGLGNARRADELGRALRGCARILTEAAA